MTKIVLIVALALTVAACDTGGRNSGGGYSVYGSGY